MKSYDPNNFVIDYIFGALDKKYKKLEKANKKAEEEVDVEAILMEQIEKSKAIETQSDKDEYYTIEISL